ncbi:phycobiliprotein lyase [Thermoleptolyngbya sichuanensis A183]|uniref:Chromophore lyase CpcS/CpeS n=1 Tax=Thermoleptolyngbya sichuanensis A183 TaxID=2737172 RepID=A0A6M8BE57_9CYAN|nr:phycobiliprotein lyase [Thermoleptolyngbya sichuanensis]QKD80935.1 phycobiliprotein lyase [Thermoleptolyngbya sichuanensis A183]
MLNFQDFFTNCAGFWKTERIYHFLLKGDIERSYTEFRADSLDAAQKQQILKTASPSGELAGIRLDLDQAALGHNCPGFAISFDTESERGEKVSMSLKALFVPDALVLHADERYQGLALPAAAQVSTAPESEVIQGFYLRDEGYSEAGAIAGRFTYQPIRQTLEMTTFYSRSVAVDQMRFIAPDVRMRTIVTYQRPPAGETPTVIDLIGFGVERKS